jgi:hypothetical protein
LWLAVVVLVQTMAVVAGLEALELQHLFQLQRVQPTQLLWELEGLVHQDKQALILKVLTVQIQFFQALHLLAVVVVVVKVALAVVEMVKMGVLAVVLEIQMVQPQQEEQALLDKAITGELLKMVVLIALPLLVGVEQVLLVEIILEEWLKLETVEMAQHLH